MSDITVIEGTDVIVELTGVPVPGPQGPPGDVSQADLDVAIAALVAAAPGALDTLNELSAALGDDADFATTVTNALAGKASLAGATFTGDVAVPDAAYDATTWNGSAQVPTKNAVRDKIESLGALGVSYPLAAASSDTVLATLNSQRFLHVVGTTAGQTHSNLFLGYEAGKNWVGSDTVYANVGVGTGALKAIVGTTTSQGHGNTAVGFEALVLQTTGQRNSVVGCAAAGSVVDATEVTAMGYHAAASLVTGSGGTFLGSFAGSNATAPATAVGQLSGQNNTGDNNTFIGSSAGNRVTSATLGTFLGARAGHGGSGNNTSAASTAVGYESLRAVTTGGNNTGLGYSAGLSITTGQKNVNVGSNADAGAAISDSVSVGYNAVSNAANAIAIGSGVAVTAAGAVAIGKDSAGTSASTSTSNDIQLGTALHTAVATSFKASGKTGATATPLILAGGTASGAPASGAHLKGEIVGDDTGKLWFCTVAGTPGTWAQIGSGAAVTFPLVAASTDTVLATLNSQRFLHVVGTTVSSTHSNLFIGYQAGKSYVGNDVSYANVGVGKGALETIVGSTSSEGHGNTAVGFEAARLQTTGQRSSVVGCGAAGSVTTASEVTAMGYHAGALVTTTGGGTFIGSFAGADATAGATAVGQLAGQYCTGVNNSFFGSSAGNRVTSATVGTFVGARAGHGGSGNNTSAASTAVGYESLKAVTTGGYNTAVGYSAGQGITTGQRNTNMGAWSDCGAAVSDSCGLGYNQTISASDAVALGSGATVAHAGSVAIGKAATTTATNQVMVGGRDIEITDTAKGLVIKSPDGTRYRVQVANGGALSAVAA